MSIIEQIRQRREKQLNAAWRRYAELLTLDNNNDPALVEEMAQLCDLLERDPVDMQHDAEVFRVLSGHERQLANYAGAGDELPAAEAEMRKVEQQIEKATAKLEEKHAALVERCRELKRQSQVAADARANIVTVKRQNPHLFPDPADAPE